MKQKVQSCCLIAGLLGTVATVAQATPTTAPLWGPSGLGIMPTTDTVPRRHGEVNLNLQNVTPDGGKVRYSPVISAAYGFKRGEIGGGYVRETFTQATPLGQLSLRFHYSVLHAKYRLMGDPNRGLSLAAGLHYLNFNSDRGNVRSSYLTGSYPLLRGDEGAKLRANLGVLYQQVRLNNRYNATRPMFGLEFLASRRFSLAADYIPASGDAERLMSLSARYQTESGLGGAVGVGRLREDTTVFGTLSYRFGVDDYEDDVKDESTRY